MATDGKDPESGAEQNEDRRWEDRTATGETGDPGTSSEAEPPVGSAFAEAFDDALGADAPLVDRDDDRGTGSADIPPSIPVEPPLESGTGNAFSRVPDGGHDVEAREDPDPGYSAYASGPEGRFDDPLANSFKDQRDGSFEDPRDGSFDDPLADWPAPDTEFARPTGMRGDAGADSLDPTRASPVSDDLLSSYTPDETRPPDDDLPEAAFFDDPIESDPAPGKPAPSPAETDENGPTADHDALPSAPDDDETGLDDSDGTAMEDTDEGFVDDFLNDLDELDDTGFLEEPLASQPGSLAAPAVDPAGAAAIPPPGIGGGTAAARSYGDNTDDGATATRSETGNISGAVTAGAEENPGLPWGMIAVVAVALLLLAGGGFGVVQQRSSLEAEIRDLQSQLATAVTPEDAAAERERQRRIELENESLAAEILALEAENRTLADQLSELEAQLEEQVAAQESAAQEEQAAAEAAAPETQSNPPGPAAAADTSETTASAGTWFVNFSSYAQEEAARSWAERLEVGSGRVVVQAARASGRTVYRVRVIDLPTQDAAERVATALERQYQRPRLWVGRN